MIDDLTEVIDSNLTINTEQNSLEVYNYFPTTIYSIKKPEFLGVVNEVSAEYLRNKDQPLNEIYPVIMSDNYYDDPRIQDFAAFIGHTAWNILDSEGYAMDNYNLRFAEMWTQEHHKHSLMETHVHGFGSQISGFYFLETPENCSRVIIQDPRPGKVQINLPEKNMNQVTRASSIINFTPEPGLLMFMNSSIPHSFGRHASDDPIKFVHFNLTAEFVKRIGDSPEVI